MKNDLKTAANRPPNDAGFHIAKSARRYSAHTDGDKRSADQYFSSLLGAYSFHETKNIISGEGGALLINDALLVERAEIIREKGTNRGQFFRGEVDKFTWVDSGSSYLPGEVIAAFLWAQMEESNQITSRRLAIWSSYHQALGPLEADGKLHRPVVPENCQQNAHMNYVLLPSLEIRTQLVSKMKAVGINTVFHYVPLHDSPVGRAFGRTRGVMPITRLAADQLLRSPLWFGLEPNQQRVIDAMMEFL